MKSKNASISSAPPDISVGVTYMMMSVLVITAVMTRLWGLGERQLNQDEYYFVKSVQNILEFGVPRYESGGYYLRGILLQYLTAFTIVAFGDGGFAYRLPSALFGVGTVIAGYFLGRQFLSRSWSIVLVAMLTFSSWEIEFSRFARMYSALQFVTVCFFLSLYRYSSSGNSNKRYIAVVFALTAILTAELGIFLAPILFIPIAAWVSRDWRTTLLEQRRYIAISATVLCLGYLQATYSFRTLGVSNILPPDFIKLPSQLPNALSFGTGLFGEVRFLTFAALVSCGLIGLYVNCAVHNRSAATIKAQVPGVLMVLAACCAIFHQFALCTVIMLVVILREPRVLYEKAYFYLLLLLAGIVIFWLVLLWFNQEWIEAYGSTGTTVSYLRSVRLAFFAFPDLYLPVIHTWANRVPVLSLLVGGAVVHQLLLVRKSALSCLVMNPVVPVLITIVFMGVRPSLYHETRYSHFLYPLLLCIVLLSASRLGETLKHLFKRSGRASVPVAIVITLVAFGASEDFNIFHLAHINSDIVTFRSGIYERFSRHWYPRWDSLRPAELVNAAESDGSVVIVSNEVDYIGFYLKKDYILYWPREADDYGIVSRESGTRELWSNKRMISSNKELINLTEKIQYVWLVFYPDWRSWKLDPEETWPGRVKNVQTYRPGRDKRIEVWKIELKPATIGNISKT